jgi:hypothetical protein
MKELVVDIEESGTFTINVPVVDPKLKKYEILVRALQLKVGAIAYKGIIDDELHDCLWEEISKVLFMVGSLSQSHFDKQSEYENQIRIEYPNNYRLSNALYRGLITEVHRPYDNLKNRLFTLLETIDDIYLRKFKKAPPNYCSYDLSDDE